MKLTINYKLTAPLSHIGTTASTGSYFQTVKTSEGKLPAVTANSVRGIIRDNGAKYLLDVLDTKVGKDVFHALFSGGNLSGATKNDINKIKTVREMIPLMSVLGGGLGDILMAGKLALTFAYPVCIESYTITGILSDVSWHSLIEDMEFTRMDDSKDDKLSDYMEDIEEEGTGKASTQMRYSVQYLAPGTQLNQKLFLTGKVNEIEKGALLSAIHEWFRLPRLGGMANKGFGFFDAEVKLTNTEDTLIKVKDGKTWVSDATQERMDLYYQHIVGNRESIIEALPLLKGGAGSGKKTN